MEKQPYKIALEYDDFGPKNSQLDLLEELKEHYPGFKVTLFTVPLDIRYGKPAPITEPEFAPWCKAVKQNEDWIEIALHGLTHLPMEFAEINEDAATKRIIVGEKMFENRGLTLAKIFKAPHWALSKDGKRAAEARGYKVCEDHYYHWNLADDFPEELARSGKVIIAHGHVQDVMGNGMAETFDKVMALPPDTQFFKLSEIL